MGSDNMEKIRFVKRKLGAKERRTLQILKFGFCIFVTGESYKSRYGQLFRGPATVTLRCEHSPSFQALWSYWWMMTSMGGDAV